MQNKQTEERFNPTTTNIHLRKFVDLMSRFFTRAEPLPLPINLVNGCTVLPADSFEQGRIIPVPRYLRICGVTRSTAHLVACGTEESLKKNKIKNTDPHWYMYAN